MIPSGLTPSVIHQENLGEGYVRVRDGRLIAAVAQLLYGQAAPTTSCRCAHFGDGGRPW